jgi:hypothetical protein
MCLSEVRLGAGPDRTWIIVDLRNIASRGFRGRGAATATRRHELAEPVAAPVGARRAVSPSNQAQYWLPVLLP